MGVWNARVCQAVLSPLSHCRRAHNVPIMYPTRWWVLTYCTVLSVFVAIIAQAFEEMPKGCKSHTIRTTPQLQGAKRC